MNYSICTYKKGIAGSKKIENNVYAHYYGAKGLLEN